MKKRKIRKKILITLLILFIVLGAFYLGKKIVDKLNINEVKVIDNIKNYSYHLEDRDTEIYKTVYNNLKNTLNEKEINEEDYAKNIAKLFVIDLFTLNNKINKYDIGSIEFVYPPALENYKINVADTLYKYMDDNSDKKRKQILPEVKEIEIKDIESTTFEIEKEKFEGYEINLSWSYMNDLKYDSSASIIVIKKDNLLYVASYKVD